MTRTREQRAADLRLIGEAVWGTRFGLPMAESLGVSQSQVSRFLSGLRTVPPELDDKLLAILDEEIGLQELKLGLMRVIRSEVGERISKARAPDTPVSEQSLTYQLLGEILDQDDK